MQTKTKRLLSAVGLATLASFAVAGSSLADDWRGCSPMSGPGHHMGGHHKAGHHGGGRWAMRMLETYDANDDGKLSQEELDQGRAERLAKFDADKDGTLSLAEFQTLWLDAMRERMVDRFQDYDADGDGQVTGDEYGKRFKRMVDRLDRNGDGLLGIDDRGPRPGDDEKSDN